jgi:anti-sigma B factor antagonist
VNYTVEDRLSICVVRFDGDLGSSEDADLRKLFVELRRNDELRVVADMSKVGFMDSTVLGTLVWGMRNMREAGGDLRLFGLKDFVRKLFAVTRLDSAFQVYPTEEEAIASYA